MPTTGIRLSAPAPTLRNRLWFVWSLFWILFFCALFAPFLVLHSLIVPTARTFVFWMRPWARSILWMCGIRLQREELAPVPDGPVVYVANHQTVLDIIATSAAISKEFLFVARHELRSWFIVGTVLAKSACLFIDRSNPRKAVESLREAAEQIRSGDSVLIFPEGARSYRHGLDPFMRGAFMLAIAAGVPVVPLTLVGHVGVLDERGHTARPGRIRFIVGEPIPTVGLTRRDAAELSDRVRESMQAQLDRFPSDVTG